MEKEERLGGHGQPPAPTPSRAGTCQRYLAGADRPGRVPPEDPGADARPDRRLQRVQGQLHHRGAGRARPCTSARSTTGSSILATGAMEYRPTEFLYGQTDRVVTQVELGERLHDRGAQDLRQVVMIQCVGSRNEQNPNCSRICCQNAVKNAIAHQGAQPGDRGLHPLPRHAHLRLARGLLPGSAPSRGCSSSASTRTTRLRSKPADTGCA